MSKEVIYNHKTCKKCRKNYITTTTIYKSEEGTLYMGDTGSCDMRISELCNDCKEQKFEEIFKS